MRPNGKRLLGASGVAVVILAVFIGIRSMKHDFESSHSAHSLRASFTFEDKLHTYDPARIEYRHQYNILRNLYATLFTYSADADLVPMLAKSFAWDGDKLVIELRSDVFTSKSQPITAEDVVESFNRVLVLGRNTHGDLRRFVCVDEKLSSTSAECPGIYEESGRVIFRIRDFRYKKFLISLLTNVDFSIVPRSAIDPKSHAIVDYSDTTGPYFVKETVADRPTVLRKNSTWNADFPHAPEEVQLIARYSREESAVDAMRSGALDFISTYDEFNGAETLEPLSNEGGETNLHSTVGIERVLLVFTPVGRKRLSVEKRRAVARKIRDAYSYRLSSLPGFRIDEAYSPPGPVVHSPVDIEKLAGLYFGGSDEDGDGVRFAVSSSNRSTHESITKAKFLPKLELVNVSGDPGSLDYTAEKGPYPDCYLMMIDAAANEDITLINYSISIGLFGMSVGEADSWLSDYMSTEARAERMDKLRKLYFQSIRDGYFLPIASAPYMAVIRKPWKMNFSPYFAGSPFWQISRD